MKKIIFLTFILLSTISFGQDDPCDAKFGKATAMPDEGWCVYAENARKRGKPSTSAECRCENGKAQYNSQIAKIEADKAEQAAATEKYNALNSEYQTAFKKLGKLTEEQIDEKISLLNAIIPVAQQLDDIQNSTSHVSIVKSDLDYLERQKRQKTITLDFGDSSSSSKENNLTSPQEGSFNSQYSTETETKPSGGNRQHTGLDDYYDAQKKIEQIEHVYANMQNDINNIIDQAFGTEPVGFDKSYNIYDEIEKLSRLRDYNVKVRQSKSVQRKKVYDSYYEPIKKTDDFFKSTHLDQDALTVLLEKSKKKPYLYIQVVRSFIDQSIDFTQFESYDIDHENSWEFKSNTLPSGNFMYSQVYKIPLKSIDPYALLQYLNKELNIKKIHYTKEYYDDSEYLLVSTTPNDLESTTKKFIDLTKKIDHITFTESKFALRNDEFNKGLMKYTKIIENERNISEKGIKEILNFYQTLKEGYPYIVKRNSITNSESEKSILIIYDEKYLLITIPNKKAFFELMSLNSKTAIQNNNDVTLYDKNNEEYHLKRLLNLTASDGSRLYNFMGSGYFGRSIDWTVPPQTLYYSSVNNNIEADYLNAIDKESYENNFNPFIEKGVILKEANYGIIHNDALITELENNGFRNTNSLQVPINFRLSYNSYWNSSSQWNNGRFSIFPVFKLYVFDNGNRSGRDKIKIKSKLYGKLSLQKIKKVDGPTYAILKMHDKSSSLGLKIDKSNITPLVKQDSLTKEEFESLYYKIDSDNTEFNEGILLFYNILKKSGMYTFESNASRSLKEKEELLIDEFYNSGVLAFQEGDYEKAEDFYKKALEIDPYYIPANLNIAATILMPENDIVDAMNALGSSPADNARYKDLETKQKEIYSIAVPYLEVILRQASEPSVEKDQAIQTMINIYNFLGDTEKANSIKKLLD